MAGSKSSTAFGVALPTAIALNAEGNVPSRIMLLPLTRDGIIPTVDRRGPYRIADPAKLVEDSMQAANAGLMPIDENHSIDIAAPKGAPSPARGWMRDLAVGADGIYAEVNWTSIGRDLVATQAYRGVSAVFEHLKDGTITRIRRAALVNNPNLRGVVALNAEGSDMEELLAKIRTLLGLDADADNNKIWDALSAVVSAATAEKAKAAAGTALQAEIAQAVKLKPDADAKALLAAVTALATADSTDQRVTALQGELSAMTENFNNLQTAIATDRATAFVDGAIKAGRVGVKPNRDHYIARHAASAEGATAVEKEVNAMPIVTGKIPVDPPETQLAFNAEDPNAIAAAASAYQEKMAKGGVALSIADSVTAVMEGKK